MAAGLEFYFNETRTPANFAGAYANYLTCTANRIGRAAAKNFFIICHISTSVDNTGTKGMVRLQVDNVDYGECADGLLHSDDFPSEPHGYTYNFVKRLSLDASSHSITLDCGRVVGANNFTAQNASIVVLEESANAQYAEREDEAAGPGAFLYLGIDFTPSTTENYLIIASCETMCEDESNADVSGVRLYELSTNTGLMWEGWGELVGPANDSIYRTVGMVVIHEFASGAERNLNMYLYGGGVDDEVYARKGYIIAIPLSDFENAYIDSQPGKTFHQTAQSNTDVVLAAQACNAADHLVICGQEVSNESPSDAGFAHLISAGPVDFAGYNFDDRDEDAAEYYLNFLVHGVTLAADNYDFAIQGDSTSDANEGAVARAYLAVCEIPPSPLAKRRIFITHV